MWAIQSSQSVRQRKEEGGIYLTAGDMQGSDYLEERTSNKGFSYLQWFHVLVNVNHLLVTVKSSFNFLIYFAACMARRGRKAGEN